MKELIFYVRNNDFASLIEVLQQNNVEGISYSDIGHPNPRIDSFGIDFRLILFIYNKLKRR